MKIRFLMLSALAAVLTASVAGASEPELVVLPIDRAKFWAGQKFDFECELRGAKADAIDVTVNGQPIAEFFGEKPGFTASDELSSLRADGVTFAKPGDVTVSASARSGGKTYQAVKHYTVVQESIKKPVKNVILYIGDGMGLQSRQIARILSKGITEGKYNGLLSMEQLTDGTALLTTSGYDSLVTDSANRASAYATGHKSVVNAMGVYENATPDPMDDPKVEDLAEILRRAKGMSIGLVTTASVTDATPAAFVSHTRRRAEQNYVATEMLKADVVLGGGARYFLPKSTAGSKRTDDRNLVEEFKKAGYAFAGNRQELAKAGGDKILGFFAMNHMNVYIDREILKDPEVLGHFTDQPNLMEMTAAALDRLSKNKNGFFLMVEGACIDKQIHTMDWQRAAYDTIEFDKAIELGRQFAKEHGDTLIICTADHSHGISITGTYHERDGKTGRNAVRTYADAGFPTFSDANGDGFPDNPDPDVTLAVQYANFPDHYENYRFLPRPTDPAVMDGKVARANKERNPNGRMISGDIPEGDPQEVHAADDVPLSAAGRGAEYFKGVMDNTEVFYGIMRALGVKATAGR